MAPTRSSQPENHPRGDVLKRTGFHEAGRPPARVSCTLAGDFRVGELIDLGRRACVRASGVVTWVVLQGAPQDQLILSLLRNLGNQSYRREPPRVPSARGPSERAAIMGRLMVGNLLRLEEGRKQNANHMPRSASKPQWKEKKEKFS